MLETILMGVLSIAIAIVFIGCAVFILGFLLSMPLAMVEAFSHRVHHQTSVHHIARPLLGGH